MKNNKILIMYISDMSGYHLADYLLAYWGERIIKNF